MMMRYTKRGISILKQGLKLLCLIFVLTVVIMLAAYLTLRYPAEATAIKSWMSSYRYAWLAWRMVIYVSIGWWVWRIWHAPGFCSEYRRPLIRMLIVSSVVVLICESVLLGEGV